jgi:signal peptidase I
MTRPAGRSEAHSTHETVARIGREIVLTAVALLGALCISSALAHAVFGIAPMVVESGSMSPAIDTGALALARTTPASDLRVGDIVTVTNRNGARVTHRIVDLSRHGATATLTLRGDANASPDSESYVVGSADKVLVDIPLAGYAMATIGSPITVVSVGGLFAWALITGGGLGLRQRRTRQLTALALVAAAATTTSVAPVASTSASYSDAATLTSGTLDATAPRPVLSCSATSSSATVSWTGHSQYDYEVTLFRTGQGVISTTQVTGAAASITYSGRAAFGITTGSGTRNYTVWAQPYLATGVEWMGAVSFYTFIRVVYTPTTLSVSCTT